MSVGTWPRWLTRTVRDAGHRLGGIGFGAAGTVGDKEERDYHYGAIPELLLSLRLMVGELGIIEVCRRQFHVHRAPGAGGGGGQTSVRPQLIIARTRP